jgi:hypothetical protein
MIARLQRLTRIRKRQRQVAAARLQQTQQHAAAVEAKLVAMHETAQQRAATGARAGELEAWAAGAGAVGRELGRAMAVVRHGAQEVQARSFAERRAQQLLQRERDEWSRAHERRQQQETDDRAGRKKS